MSPKEYIAENEFVGNYGLGTWVKGLAYEEYI
jgi:hypothetical protein